MPGKIAVMFSDVTQRHVAEKAREHLMRQLTAKNEELESLVYIASHDLRSPLVNIRGFSGELQKNITRIRAIVNSQPLSEAVRRHLDHAFDSDISECLAFINSGSL